MGDSSAHREVCTESNRGCLSSGLQLLTESEIGILIGSRLANLCLKRFELCPVILLKRLKAA